MHQAVWWTLSADLLVSKSFLCAFVSNVLSIRAGKLRRLHGFPKADRDITRMAEVARSQSTLRPAQA